MLNTYRRRFVRLNMTMVGIVLLLVFVVISVFVFREYRLNLMVSMREYLQPLQLVAGVSPETAAGGEEIGAQSSVIAALYRAENDHVTILTPDVPADREILFAAVREAYGRTEDYDILREYGLVYYRVAAGDDVKIAFTDTEALWSSMRKLAGIMVLVFLAAMALCYSISLRISKVAVRPLEDAWQRERKFIADASHELKTPLTVILANTSILRYAEENGAEDRMRWIESTERTAAKMSRLLEDMLSLSEIEAVGQTVECVPVSFSNVVTRAVLEMEALAYDKKIQVETDVEPGLSLNSREDYLSRIIGNLISNALKFEPEGGQIRISLRARHGDAVFTVWNRSTVIDPDSLAYVFERFYQTDKTSEDGRKGHGLGLAIAKTMTETLGGKIQVFSSEEEGTTFQVEFHLN